MNPDSCADGKPLVAAVTPCQPALAFNFIVAIR
jgi:hypothetical protein